MATFDPPREIVPIFNPVDWIPFGDDPLTVAEGDGRYLRLVGGTEKGSVVFNKDISVAGTATMSNVRMEPIAIGVGAGLNQDVRSVAVGYEAGKSNQSSGAIGLGNTAGNFNQGFCSIAIGQNSGANNQIERSIAIGTAAGFVVQGTYGVAIGTQAGNNNQGSSAVAIGYLAGNSLQGESAIAIGKESGQTNQQINSISIGNTAGQYIQNQYAIGVGYAAGGIFQGEHGIAIGSLAGNYLQSSNAIAIGRNSGQNSQFQNSVAIGLDSGNLNQGSNSIAIGFSAGKSNQHENTIILNASGTDLNSDGTGRTFINPIRQSDGISTGVLSYNTTTREITHSQNLNFDSNTLVIDRTNDRVGIGTTSPLYPLHVNGSCFLEGANANLYIGNDSDSESPRIRMFTLNSDSYFDWGSGTLRLRSGAGTVNERARFGSSFDIFTNLNISTNSSANVFNNTANAVEVIPAVFTATGIGTGRSTTVRIGKDANTAYNTAQLTHFYNDNGSNLNRLDFGFFGIGARMSVRGDGRVGIGTTSPSQLLDVNGGNIRCSGSVQPEAWIAGQVIQVRHFGPDNTTPSNYSFSTNTFTTWVSVNFTPRSTSSKILIEADGNYSINGGALDFFEIRVLDAGVVKYVKDQVFNNTQGGGTRSSVVLPLSCGFTNNATSTRTFEIQIRQGSSDDTLAFPDGNNNWSLIMTEIQV